VRISRSESIFLMERCCLSDEVEVEEGGTSPERSRCKEDG